ncbi:MAG: D-alanine--D-alanine ligase [bacterium]|nr:D-alanine--D-alanine ligase [bacterium]
MQGTIVGVLRGGPSCEHEVSLKTGAAILANLSPERFLPRDIYIDRAGQWYERGRPLDPVRALRGVDVALIGLHGEYGEDGGVQKLLEQFGVPYAGADSFGSFLAMHKVMAKERAREAGLRTPDYRFFSSKGGSASGGEEGNTVDEFVRGIIRTFHQPVVVKPVRWGSSVGVSIVGGYAPVLRAIESLVESGANGILVEELIRGREATAGVVEGLRGEDLYALPPIEIIPPEGDFFSYNSKYSGETREICPGNFSRVVLEDLATAAKTMHKALGLRHYSRSDFIVAPKGIYYLETNTLPGMTEESLLPKSLAAIGVSFRDFLTHLVDLALKR